MGESDEVVSEVWTAQHPTRGAIKLTIATPEHLRTIDAGWRRLSPTTKTRTGKTATRIRVARGASTRVARGRRTRQKRPKG